VLTWAEHQLIVRTVKVVPRAAGSCAFSGGGIQDDAPVGSGRFENIVAIGKLVDKSGLVRGWVYRTTSNALLVQTVAPPVDLQHKSAIARTMSGYDPLTKMPPYTVEPCTTEDFNNTRTYRHHDLLHGV
jgi:hypothetical protein